MTNDYFVNETLRLLGFYCSCDAPKSPKGDKLREHPNCANVSYKQGSRGAGEQGSRGAGEQGSRGAGERIDSNSLISLYTRIFLQKRDAPSRSTPRFFITYTIKNLSVPTLPIG
jgi:hypothetical protein